MSAVNINKDNLKLVASEVAKESAIDNLVAANEDNTHMKMLNSKTKEKSARMTKVKTPAQIKTMEFF